MNCKDTVMLVNPAKPRSPHHKSQLTPMQSPIYHISMRMCINKVFCKFLSASCSHGIIVQIVIIKWANGLNKGNSIAFIVLDLLFLFYILLFVFVK